jgi:hypothetical protein
VGQFQRLLSEHGTKAFTRSNARPPSCASTSNSLSLAASLALRQTRTFTPCEEASRNASMTRCQSAHKQPCRFAWKPRGSRRRRSFQVLAGTIVDLRSSADGAGRLSGTGSFLKRRTEQDCRQDKEGTMIDFARKHDCEACALEPKCRPNAPARKIARSIHEAARDCKDRGLRRLPSRTKEGRDAVRSPEAHPLARPIAPPRAERSQR